MCYNVLCDKYATRQMYGYCPSWALSWEYRKKVRCFYLGEAHVIMNILCFIFAGNFGRDPTLFG